MAAKSILVEMLARKPELFGELRPLFGVLDAGQSVAVEGIKVQIAGIASSAVSGPRHLTNHRNGSGSFC